jgi:hypothetical protein
MAKIGVSTVNIVIQCSINFNDSTESVDRITVITNDASLITASLVAGILQGVQLQVLQEGVEIVEGDVTTSDEDKCDND